MKKQLIAIGLASVLTAPSVALAQEEEAAAAEEMAVEEMAAEAPAGPSVTVYGSFRTALEFTSGEGAGDATVLDFASRFGLTGSSEVSEGLTASFKLENSFNTATATIGSGRIGKVGLSGGFGSVEIGQMWSASKNHFGGVLNQPWWYGVYGGSTAREARMVSYSSSVGAVGFQIDRHTDASGAATIEFGASTSAGPVSVGLGYWSKEDSPDTTDITYTRKVTRVKVPGDPGDDATQYTGAINGAVLTATEKTTKHPKTSFTGFVVSSSLAGMNLAIGVGSTDHGVKNERLGADKTVLAKGANDPVDESQTDVSIVTLTGAIGDSGVSYVVQMSDSDKVWETKADGSRVDDDPSRSVIGLTSALGGGASLVFEHASYKGSADASLVGLIVNF